MNTFLSTYFLSSFIATIVLTFLSMFLPSKFIDFVDTGTFGAKILSENVVTGVKTVVILSLTWFAMINLGSAENNQVFDLVGKKQTSELLGIATHFVTVLMLFGMLYGISKHQNESNKLHERSLSDTIIRVMSIIPALMVIGVATLHIIAFGLF